MLFGGTTEKIGNVFEVEMPGLNKQTIKINNIQISDIDGSTLVNQLTEQQDDLQHDMNSDSEDANNEVSEVNNTTIGNNDFSKETNYIELNETNYSKYTPSRITNIANNNDGTYTIMSRVYEEASLPNLTKNEVNKLEYGGLINILGWEFQKDFSENTDNNDFVIKCVDENMWLKLYVNKNDDGTAFVFYYSEIQIAKPM